MTNSWPSWRKKIAWGPLRDLRSGVGTPRHERVPTAPCHRDPVGAKATAAAVRSLADEPRPAEARALGASGYFRLHIGAWRVLYRPDDTTVTIHVLKVGRST